MLQLWGSTQWTDCNQKCIKENDVIMTKENFLVFIMKVINVTAVMTSRSAKIKTILDAAADSLGITGISAHMIHDIKGYKSILKDRKGSQGGGVVTFIKDEMTYRVVGEVEELECG